MKDPFAGLFVVLLRFGKPDAEGEKYDSEHACHAGTLDKSVHRLPPGIRTATPQSDMALGIDGGQHGVADDHKGKEFEGSLRGER